MAQNRVILAVGAAKSGEINALDELVKSLLLDRRRNLLRYYRPTAKQRTFHELLNYMSMFCAGNGSGKTFAGAQEFALAMTGRHWMRNKYSPPPLDGRICAEKPALMAEGEASNAIIPLLKRLLRNDLAQGFPKKVGASLEVQWKLKNGSAFDILTYDQDDDKFESVSKDVIWFDEPPRKSIFIASTARMRKGTGGKLIFTMTPLLEAAWMYDMIVTNQNDDIGIVEASIWDNCIENGGYLTRVAIERMIRQWDESERDARVYGKFIIMRDIAFPTFNPDVHIVEEITSKEVADRSLQLYSVIDPHSKRPPAWGLYGFDEEDNLYIIDEWPNYFDGAYANKFYDSIKETQFDYEHLVKIFHKIEKGYGGNIVNRFIDPRYAKQNNPNTQRTTLEELQRAALRGDVRMHWSIPTVGADVGEGEISSGIDIIRQMLAYDKNRPIEIGNRPALYVSARCVNHIRMFQYLKYETLKGSAAESRITSDKLEQRFKDFCDILRYLVKTVKGYRRQSRWESNYTYQPVVSSVTGY